MDRWFWEFLEAFCPQQKKCGRNDKTGKEKPERKAGDRIKNVLWISRHEMTPDQFADLERALHEPVKLSLWQENVTDISQLISCARQYDAVAAVLPTGLMAQLKTGMENGRLLQSVGSRTLGEEEILPDGRRERKTIFRHEYWQEIQSIRIETRRL